MHNYRNLSIAWPSYICNWRLGKNGVVYVILISELYGWRRCRYVCMYACMYVCNRTFNRQIFAVCPLQVCMVRKWLSLANRSNFPFGALPVSIVSSETKAAVPPCPSSFIYAAKSGRQATTVVARYIRCSVRQVSKEGLKHSNRAQIALACLLGSISTSNAQFASMVQEW